MSGRALKFRIWAGDAFYYTDDLLSGVLGFHSADRKTLLMVRQDANITPHTERLIMHSSEGLVLEQFTGLVDRNGREVYEGDIVRWFHGREDIGVVGYSLNDAFSGYPNTAYYGVNVKHLGGWCSFQQDDEYMVLGNIHEHSHLLAPAANEPSTPTT